MTARCGRRFFSTDPATLAQKLLGQRLVRVLDSGERLAGTIVETEAYLGVEDRAAHTFGGRRTPRNEAMYGAAGTAYVYFTYGMHHCMNVVAGRLEEPVAVLIRALEPTEGLGAMRGLRSGPRRSVKLGKAKAGLREDELCSGPARLCQALAIDRQLNGIDLTTDSRLWIERARRVDPGGLEVRMTARVGVEYAGVWADKKLRWFVDGNRHVSRSKG